MSTTSIYNLSDNKLHKDVDALLLKYGQKEMLNLRFAVGTASKLTDMSRILRLERIVRDNHCSIEHCMDKVRQMINKLNIKNG